MTNRLGNKIRGGVRWLFIFMILILFDFCLNACGSVTRIAEEKPVLIISFGDKRDVPGSSSAIYQFSIYEDGLVIYRGEFDVNVIGERREKITAEQVQELITLFMKIYHHFEDIGFLGKNKNFLPRRNLFLMQLDYQDRKLVFGPGHFADYILANLNRSIPIENWLCPAPSLPENDADCRSFKDAASIQTYIDKHP